MICKCQKDCGAGFDASGTVYSVCKTITEQTVSAAVNFFRRLLTTTQQHKGEES